MSKVPEPLIFWCESERACRHVLTLLAELGRPVATGRSVSETVAALHDHPAAHLLLVCFVGAPPAHAQAACRRFREAGGDRRLRLLALLEPSQLPGFSPTWGVDDFALFPASAPELAARLDLITWRDKHLQTDTLVKVGPLVVNTDRHEVLVHNRPVALTVKEYELLLLLVGGRDRVLTREAILNAVWGADYYGGERTVDVHIRRLRAKLEPIASCIETVHGIGYRFTPERAEE